MGWCTLLWQGLEDVPRLDVTVHDAAVAAGREMGEDSK